MSTKKTIPNVINQAPYIGRCACGNLAFRRGSGGPVCKRCAGLEAKMPYGRRMSAGQYVPGPTPVEEGGFNLPEHKWK